MIEWKLNQIIVVSKVAKRQISRLSTSEAANVGSDAATASGDAATIGGNAVSIEGGMQKVQNDIASIAI